MGLDSTSVRFLHACMRSGVDFTRTLTLGRQQMLESGEPADAFLQQLGAETVDSLDASSFEGATIIADLNRPLPAELEGSYTAVVDAGTLEHVFDVARAVRSTAGTVAVGGHYIAISPANNWPGHGFYQFSPELMFRMLSPAAGFEVRGAFVIEHRREARWFAVADPERVGSRVAWRSGQRASLAVVAQRTRICDLYDYVPQQSDYASRWGDEGAGGTGAPTGRLKEQVWRVAPPTARRVYESVIHARQERFDPRFFTRVDASGLASYIGSHTAVG